MIDTVLVIAPMAGGPTTVELAVESARAGAFPFLAAGYLTAARVEEDALAYCAAFEGDGEAAVRGYGINLFVPAPEDPAAANNALEYAARLAPWAEVAGVELGQARWSDEDYTAKLDAILALPVRPAVVSFTFGWPSAQYVARLHDAAIEVWCTVNAPGEVDWAVELGADAVVAQGWEAGGHRGGPVDTGEVQLPALELLREIVSRATLPVVSAGGVANAADVRERLAAGATAVAVGTAVLLADEAGTSPVHRDALASREGTVVTRAFTGRSARALRTSWTDLVPDGGPSYPHVHFLTQPLRAHGKATGNPELVHLWAGERHAQAESRPVAEIVRGLLDTP